MSNPIHIRLGGVPEHFNLLWELDECRQVFTELGIEYEFYEFPGGTGAMSEAVKSGFLDGAIILTEGAVTEISRGANYKIVSPFVESPLFWGIFSSAYGSVTNLEELDKRVFAISRFNSGSHLMAQYIAFKAGVRLTKDNFYPANDLQGARKALKEGKADLFLWEKFMTRPLVMSGEFRQVGEVSPPWGSFVAVLSEKSVENYPHFPSLLCKGISRAGERFKKMHGIPDKIVARYGISKEDARDWFDQVVYYGGGELYKEKLVNSAKLLHQFNISDRVPREKELFFDHVKYD
jgi:ABC-type nitrate/sulfonate/bicarbonate transport system substrate-binding protein